MIGFLAGLLLAALVTAGILLVAAGALHVAVVLLVGVVAGALGHLVLEGPEGTGPLTTGPGATILVGIGGSFLGGLAGWFAFGGGAPRFLLPVVGAASVVWLVRRPDHSQLA